jgi:hypothetical protein
LIFCWKPPSVRLPFIDEKKQAEILTSVIEISLKTFGGKT